MNVTLPIHRHALRQPNKPALIGARGPLTYRQLDQLIWRGAAHFRRLGLGHGERAALMIGNPFLHFIATLSLARLGVACLALSRDQGAVVASMMRRIGARHLVCERGVGEIEDCAQIIVDAAAFSIGESAAAGLLSEDPDRVWRFVTSSGTTGKPKLLAISHAGLSRRFHRYQLAVPCSPSDVFLSMPHITFAATAIRTLHALTTGATAVVPGSAAEPAIGGLMSQAGANRLFAVPSTLQGMLQSPTAPAAMKGISVLEVGGAVVSRALRERILKQLTPGLHVYYGVMETHTLSVASGMATIAIADTVGHPLPEGDLEIVDDAGQALPPGRVGQVRARNAAMVTAYLDDAAADERFFRNGWCYPGDLACWSGDGQVIFKGRADDMMIFNGVNIFPTEIESCLHEHPGIIEAIAFPLPSDRHGEIPAAAVRVRADLTEAELIGFAKERLGPGHPRKLLIVEDFPRNPMGKPLKREVSRMMMHTAGIAAPKR